MTFVFQKIHKETLNTFNFVQYAGDFHMIAVCLNSNTNF